MTFPAPFTPRVSNGVSLPDEPAPSAAHSLNWNSTPSAERIQQAQRALSPQIKKLAALIESVDWKFKNDEGQKIFFSDDQLAPLKSIVTEIKTTSASLGFTENLAYYAIAKSSVSHIFLKTVLTQSLEQFTTRLQLIESHEDSKNPISEVSFEIEVLHANIGRYRALQKSSNHFFTTRKVGKLMGQIGRLLHQQTLQPSPENEEQILRLTQSLNGNRERLAALGDPDMRYYGDFSETLDGLRIKISPSAVENRVVFVFFQMMLEKLKLQHTIPQSTEEPAELLDHA